MQPCTRHCLSIHVASSLWHGSRQRTYELILHFQGQAASTTVITGLDSQKNETNLKSNRLTLDGQDENKEKCNTGKRRSVLQEYHENATLGTI